MAVKNNLGEQNFKGPIELVELRRLVQREDQPNLVSSPPEQKYHDWTFTKSPIHNFWGTLALIYTLCIGSVEIDPVSSISYS